MEIVDKEHQGEADELVIESSGNAGINNLSGF
jgi:hypothetical protein